MKKDAIVWFSIFDWWTSSHGHSDFQLAKAMAKDRPVLFINSIGIRMPVPGKTERPVRKITRKLLSLTKGLKRPDTNLPNLAVLTLAMPPVPAGKITSVFMAIAVQQVKLSLLYLGWSGSKAIVTVPTACEIARKLVGSRLIYYRSDRHSTFDEAHAFVRDTETYLLKNAPIVAYSSAQLMQAEIETVGTRGRMLEHAVDPNLFNTNLDPAPDLAAYPGPRLGFFGSLRGHSLDFELIRDVALAMPDASILVMGDRSDCVTVLEGVDNLYVLPPRPHSKMPAAWAALDVAMMPYKNTEWMLGVEPIKLREILAVGVPVAAVNVGAASTYPEAIFETQTREGFILAIRAALASRRSQDWMFKTWLDQADVLSEWIDNLPINVVGSPRNSDSQ